jgi:hypothetical protein
MKLAQTAVMVDMGMSQEDVSQVGGFYAHLLKTG